jgi:hypothetical protein
VSQILRPHSVKLLPIQTWRPTSRIIRRHTFCNVQQPTYHDQRDTLPHFKELTVITLQYKYRSTSRYLVTNLLLLKYYCYYTREIDLNIGVEVTGTPSKHSYCSIVLQKEIGTIFNSSCHQTGNCFNRSVFIL